MNIKRNYSKIIFVLTSLCLLTSCGNKPEEKPIVSHDWSVDETYHWHNVTYKGQVVDYRDKAAHAYGDYIIDIPATDDEKGLRHKECSICLYKGLYEEYEEKFEPGTRDIFIPKQEGKTLLFIGQDFANFGGCIDTYDYGYTDYYGVPMGYTNYTVFTDDVYKNVSRDKDGNLTGCNLAALINNANFKNIYIHESIQLSTNAVLEKINNKECDDIITNYVKFFNLCPDNKFFIRIGYEFDDSNLYDYEPESFVNAFKRISKALIKRCTNKNIVTVWSPHGINSISTMEKLNNFYPGDEYVDWIGYSDFNTPENPSTNVETFAKSHNKPIFITEASPINYNYSTIDGEKEWSSGWIRKFLTHLDNKKDQIRAVSYINADWLNQSLWKNNNSYFKTTDSRFQANEYLKQAWGDYINDDNCQLLSLSKSDAYKTKEFYPENQVVRYQPDNGFFIKTEKALLTNTEIQSVERGYVKYAAQLDSSNEKITYYSLPQSSSIKISCSTTAATSLDVKINSKIYTVEVPNTNGAFTSVAVTKNGNNATIVENSNIEISNSSTNSMFIEGICLGSTDEAFSLKNGIYVEASEVGGGAIISGDEQSTKTHGKIVQLGGADGKSKGNATYTIPSDSMNVCVVYAKGNGTTDKNENVLSIGTDKKLLPLRQTESWNKYSGYLIDTPVKQGDVVNLSIKYDNSALNVDGLILFDTNLFKTPAEPPVTPTQTLKFECNDNVTISGMPLNYNTTSASKFYAGNCLSYFSVGNIAKYSVVSNSDLNNVNFVFDGCFYGTTTINNPNQLLDIKINGNKVSFTENEISGITEKSYDVHQLLHANVNLIKGNNEITIEPKEISCNAYSFSFTINDEDDLYSVVPYMETLRIEAESTYNFENPGNKTRSNQYPAGKSFSAGYVVGYFTKSNSAVSYDYLSDIDGRVKVTLLAATGNKTEAIDMNNTLIVTNNGNDVSFKEGTYQSGDWNTFAPIEFEMDVIKGKNTLKIVNSYSVGFNLDYFDMTGIVVSESSPKLIQDWTKR